MWDDTKQERLDALRRDEFDGSLSNTDRTELDALLTELDREEAAQMEPALARARRRERELRDEKAFLEAEAAELRRIADEQERIVGDARDYLARLRARRAALAAEYRRVVASR